MIRPSVFVLLCLFHIGKSSVKEIVLNEDTILGRCGGTCRKVGTHYNKAGCAKLYGCVKNSDGWDVVFVGRCNWCKCQCEKKDTEDNKDMKAYQTWLKINERELYKHGCRSDCPKRGLVRSNLKGCEEVRDCFRDRHGYLYAFVYCDHCKCKCINWVSATKYELFDMKYDMSAVNKVKGKPTALANTYVENRGNKPQTITRTISFQRSSTKSLSTTVSIQAGLAMTVKAGVSAGVASVEASVSYSITAGFSTTTGKQDTETSSDSIEASCVVPPHSKKQIIIKANKVKVNVPFTGKIKRIYKDKSVKIESTSGILIDMVVGDARVIYMPSEKL